MISIIMCVYNGEKYMEKSLNAIFNSTYKDFELIIINDGSTDRTESIIQTWMLKYTNIRYYKQKNHGLAFSRNRGVAIAKGEWITFVDADDVISPIMLENLYSMAIQEKSDIVYTKLKKFREESELEKYINLDIEQTQKIHIYSKIKYIKSYFECGLGNVCGGLFKKKLIQGIEFPNGLLYEDNPVKLAMLLRTDKVVVINKGIYYYRTNEDSITNNAQIQKLDYILILGIQYEILRKNKIIWIKMKNDYWKYAIKKYQDIISELRCKEGVINVLRYLLKKQYTKWNYLIKLYLKVFINL